MVDTILFDLDGTLINTLKDLKEAVNYTLGNHNLPLQTIEQVKNNVGNGVEKLIERSIGDYNEDVFASCLKEFKEYYSSHLSEFTTPYEGICEMLEALHKDYKIGVVSNKYDSAVKSLCKKYFDGLIDVAIGQTEISNKKPATDTVFLALNELGSKKAIFIGDSVVDIQTARNAKMECISVAWGYRPYDELVELNDKIINKPEEIFNYLRLSL